MVNGNLLSYLRRDSAVDKLSLIFDIARGLQYLHARKPAVIHGDLKSNNVLVTPSGTACLADFGLGRLASDERRSPSSILPGGALLFCAPELLAKNPEGSQVEYPEKTTQSDIYAFACLCYEVYYSSTESSKSLASQLKAVRGGGPCLKPASMEEELWEWLKRMWSVDPTQRPTMLEFLDGTKGKRSPNRTQHTWDSVTTTRLRSVSLIPSDPLADSRRQVGMAYPLTFEPTTSSSTLVTVTTESIPTVNPSPPPLGTHPRHPGPSIPSYESSGHSSTLPSYTTQDQDSNLHSPWPDTQPSIITNVGSAVTIRSNDIIIA
ncbi:kinase-like domain-containing protein [Coprinopsis sp. MPI-PUGE-AT-0042]|nr:kinase-like domain-containing protein [Coprinopsis sp. MPI-PUGE-AT-0042]